jgi:hypothetical protein
VSCARAVEGIALDLDDTTSPSRRKRKSGRRVLPPGVRSTTCDSGYSPASCMRKRAKVSAGDPAAGSVRRAHRRACCAPRRGGASSAMMPAGVTKAGRIMPATRRRDMAESAATTASSRGPARRRSATVRAGVVTASPFRTVRSVSVRRVVCTRTPGGWSVEPRYVALNSSRPESGPFPSSSILCSAAAAVWLQTR